MAKKEIRVNFNLDNENEKELYEFLLSKTSASGYLKDLALDFLHSTGRAAATGARAQSDQVDNALNNIVDTLKDINFTLSNIKVVSTNTTETAITTEDERVIDSANVKELDIEADDLDF